MPDRDRRSGRTDLNGACLGRQDTEAQTDKGHEPELQALDQLS